MSAWRGFGRVLAGVAVVAGLVVCSAACTPHQQMTGERPTTLTAAPAEPGECGPDQLVRCVPGLADIEENTFDAVSVYEPRPEFAAVPPGAARDSAAAECQNLPRFGAKDKPGLDVDYRPATDANGKTFGTRFPANGGEYFHARFLVAGDTNDLTSGMTAWARRCPWAIAETMTGNGVNGWLVAQNGDKLAQYQSGDVAYQWPYVTQMAAALLPNKVIVQAWYRTNDPSAESRNHLLSQLIDAAGRPRPRSALPPQLADWSQLQISTLLPALSMDTGISAATGDNTALSNDPGGRLWSLCPSGDHAPTPRYDPLARWHDFDQSKWDQPGKPLRPNVTISRAHAGDNFLADLRREITDCTTHLKEKPALCGDRENRQVIQTDSVAAEGEDAVRLTHRWLRETSVRGHSMCSEGIEALRVAQVRGLIVITSSSQGGYLFRGDAPPLPLTTLDGLLAETIRRIKAA